MLAACRKHGIDPVTEFIPVAPGAHYSCGGILADLDGQTSVAGLYAVGEAASTGVQGANRLASNSVTEAIIAGRRAGRVIAARGDGQVIERKGGTHSELNPARGPVRAAGDGTGNACSADGDDPGGVPQALASVMSRWAVVMRDRASYADAGAPGRSKVDRGRRALAAAMSRWAGVMRDREGLTELARMISATGGEAGTGGAVATGSETREGSGEAASVPAE